ncbi:Hsp33 family molecular chaperone HslO, partial [Staphylococcus aureus]|uniref:Hsp33 family molecular chaperone HslO n=1 Tax=Staphylococcus aureus TaxID=1280 RepID=UPI0021753496
MTTETVQEAQTRHYTWPTASAAMGRIMTATITLSVVGAVATWYTLPIAGAVLILLAALIMSYRQIIYAYPKG